MHLSPGIARAASAICVPRLLADCFSLTGGNTRHDAGNRKPIGWQSSNRWGPQLLVTRLCSRRSPPIGHEVEGWQRTVSCLGLELPLLTIRRNRSSTSKVAEVYANWSENVFRTCSGVRRSILWTWPRKEIEGP